MALAATTTSSRDTTETATLGAVTQGQVFSIKVLEGPDANDPDASTKYTLIGRALPYTGVSFPTEQRGKTTYYPGNPIATQQKMGPIEKNTVIQGMWKDRFLGTGAARNIADMFRDLCRSGYQVEVSWGSLLVDNVNPDPSVKPIVRRGYVKRITPTYDRPQDVKYEIEFEWQGDATATAPAFTAIKQANPWDAFQAAQFDLGDMADSVVSYTESFNANSVLSLPTTILSAVSESLSNVYAATDFLDSIGRSINDFSQLPTNIVQRLSATTQQASISCINLRNSLLSINRTWQDPTDDPFQPLQNEGIRSEMLLSADAAQEASLAAVAQAQAMILPETIAEVKPIPGTDLRDLALTWYGNPDLWFVIADYNGMSTSAVPMPPSGPSDQPIFTIKIPRRTQSLQGGAGTQGY